MQWYDTPHAARYEIRAVGGPIADAHTYGTSLRDMPRPVDWFFRGGRRPKFEGADDAPWNLQALAVFRHPHVPSWEAPENRGGLIVAVSWEAADDHSDTLARAVQETWDRVARELPFAPPWIRGARVVDKSSRRRGLFHRVEIWCDPSVEDEGPVLAWLAPHEVSGVVKVRRIDE